MNVSANDQLGPPIHVVPYVRLVPAGVETRDGKAVLRVSAVFTPEKAAKGQKTEFDLRHWTSSIVKHLLLAGGGFNFQVRPVPKTNGTIGKIDELLPLTEWAGQPEDLRRGFGADWKTAQDRAQRCHRATKLIDSVI